MNSYKHILTKKEKLMITDMVMGTNHLGFLYAPKKQFKVKELCAAIIRKHTGKPFSLGNKWKDEFKDYSINLIWDKDTNETVFMHFFANPDYSYSHKIFEQFKDLNSDIDAINNDGSTALMFLAKNPNRYTMCSSIMNEEPNFNLYIKDKYGKTFHMYFFEHYTEDVLSYEYNHKDLRDFAVLGKIAMFKKVLLNWVNADINKDKEHLLYVAEKCSMLIKCVNNESNLLLHDQVKDIKIIADKLHLEATMEVNPNNQKKPKI